MADKKSMLESFDSGSNYHFGDKLTTGNTPRSMFDYSHLVTTTINNAGVVVPLGRPIETLPNSDYELSVRSLVRVLPQVVPLYSRQRMYVYAFYSPYSILWNNFETFMKKGYDGNTIKHIPTMNEYNLIPIPDSTYNFTKPGSLLNYLGIPSGLNYSKIKSLNLNALTLMNHLRIWRDYFCNKNFYIGDRDILPDDDSRFRMDDDGKILSFKDNGHSCTFNPSLKLGRTSSTNFNIGMFFHDYPSDYFTSALPFAQRGDAPSIDLLKSDAGFLKLFAKRKDTGTSNSISATSSAPSVSQLATIYMNDYIGGPSTFDLGIQATEGDFKAKIFLDDLRYLSIAQTELEKLAHTDGSYGQFGLTFFSEKSKHSMDYTPFYIGGCYTNLQFSEVIQTSNGDSSSPLGTYGGHGIGADNHGYIGKCHSDDFGLIQLYVCIMPDVYYSQGIDKFWTRNSQDEFYLPERSKLGMVPILNKELFVSNTSTLDDDNNLWAYQNPFDEFRYMPNTISGKIAESSNESFFPYTQSRVFTSLPNYSEDFMSADNVRKDYLQAPEEDAYSAQFSIDCRAVLPLPYRSSPASILN